MLDPETIPDDPHCFYTKDGKIIRNLAQLRDELKVMPPEVFDHHVNERKNDFSSWIKDVFGQEKIANKISAAKTRDDLIDLLDKNVALMIMLDMPRRSEE